MKGAGIADVNPVNKPQKEEAKPLSRDVILLEQYERLCKLQRQRREHLRMQMSENGHDARVSMHRVSGSWRAFMRNTKAQELAMKSQIDSLEVQRKSALSQSKGLSLLSNLRESHSMHTRVHRSHSGALERLEHLCEQERRRYEKSFENAVYALTEEFRIEEKELTEQHKVKLNEARSMMASLIAILFFGLMRLNLSFR